MSLQYNLDLLRNIIFTFGSSIAQSFHTVMSRLQKWFLSYGLNLTGQKSWTQSLSHSQGGIPRWFDPCHESEQIHNIGGGGTSHSRQLTIRGFLFVLYYVPNVGYSAEKKKLLVQQQNLEVTFTHKENERILFNVLEQNQFGSFRSIGYDAYKINAWVPYTYLCIDITL